MDFGPLDVCTFSTTSLRADTNSGKRTPYGAVEANVSKGIFVPSWKRKQLQDLRADTARLLERLEQAKARTQNQTWADTESQMEMIKSIVQDAKTMIEMHQRLLPS
ncbi:hypothetical protein BBP40_010972 [Aspergillus hancockii]|nr:hypothetical protein BBP40_010972 [Aspergillus hancockii]